MTEPRFYIDHGVIHDRETGKHVVTDGEPPFEDSVEQVCDLLNSLVEQARKPVGWMGDIGGTPFGPYLADTESNLMWKPFALIGAGLCFAMIGIGHIGLSLAWHTRISGALEWACLIGFGLTMMAGVGLAIFKIATVPRR